jgi:hypothetical protein
VRIVGTFLRLRGFMGALLRTKKLWKFVVGVGTHGWFVRIFGVIFFVCGIFFDVLL